ncbi:asparagine-linked glycosylation protein [Homalodisca vitripennis]|nr:asparagine-linked glycosylation protein [Homalodisca vitripennis]
MANDVLLTMCCQFHSFFSCRQSKIDFLLYRTAGGSADIVMVNSSWTKGHILDLWQRQDTTHLVYPPCDILPLRLLDHRETDEVRIVSLGQFRPEKDHPLQVRAFQIVKSKVSPDVWSKVKLVLIGSCRDAQDEARVEAIRQLVEDLSVTSNVEFKVNISFDELKEQFSLGTVGLHTMWNEHFGIGEGYSTAWLRLYHNGFCTHFGKDGPAPDREYFLTVLFDDLALVVTAADKGELKAHVVEVTAKAERVAAGISRFMINVNGVLPSKRCLLSLTVNWIVLYGALVWISALKMKKVRKQLDKVQ